ncbi:hypothetical protein BDN71DRAFT_1448821 [Pleurotus eryngii]|uniref:Uncharacterized protein n=1 Tax=Pleurotus eryngii TaxID=5323 RepID=A0A9P5ZXG3_PLEER|nr:hypothetical protein BDN71DRAFT_1448821 [Pleurotus eryngii]
MGDEPRPSKSVEVSIINEVNVEVGDFKIRSIAQSVPGVKVRELENVDDLAASNADSSLVPVQASSHGRDVTGGGDDDGANEGESSNGDHVLTAEPEVFELAEQLPDRIKASTVSVDAVGKERRRARAPSGEMRKADMSPRTIREIIKMQRAKRPSDTALRGEDGTKERKRARVESVARAMLKKARSSRTAVRNSASAKRVNLPAADEVKADDQVSRGLLETNVLAPTKGTKRRRTSNVEEPLVQQVGGDIASPSAGGCREVNGEDTRAAKRFHQNVTLEDGDNESRGSRQFSETRV